MCTRKTIVLEIPEFHKGDECESRCAFLEHPDSNQAGDRGGCRIGACEFRGGYTVPGYKCPGPGQYDLVRRSGPEVEADNVY